jgi:hypothetical protein
VATDLLTPTHEQQQALDLFATGGPLVIEAGAGTGKTSTLELLSRSTPRTGCYVAFNNSIAGEAAGRFPMTVVARTMHSFAYRVLADRLNIQARLKAAARMPSWKVAQMLGVDYLALEVSDPVKRTKVLQPGTLGSHIQEALVRFCQSGDPEPTVRHFPYIDGIDPLVEDDSAPAGVRRGWDNNNLVRAELLPALQDAWVDVSSPNGRLKFTHDHYLKVWQLNDPRLPGEFVLIDEAQDFNGVMLAVAAAQDAQAITVGDSQQQIYEWRGSLNAMDAFDGYTVYLSQSFRFGHQIAEVANALLQLLESPLQLRGTDTIPSVLGPVDRPRAFLCRTNAKALDIVLEMQRQGVDVHLVGGGREILAFARAAGRLMAGDKPYHSDLSAFESWREVQAYVDDDPSGSDLKMMVKLVDKYGVDVIETALSDMPAEDRAEVIVSTAHKAKGREWETVALTSDFDDRLRDDTSPGELRLLYVACTRAQHRLDLTACPEVRTLAGLP